MVIAIDFDGTCVTHEFPFIGKDIGAQSVLKKLTDRGHKLILFTMRSNIENPASENKDIVLKSGNYLDEALRWFKKNKIPLFSVQTNPNQSQWTSSPKCYAEMYIDDLALGCPLKFDPKISKRKFVDWEEIEILLYLKGILD